MGNQAAIVQKLWNYCNVLRDDGMSYGDYPSTALRTGVEQLSWSVLSSGGDVGHVCDTVAMTGCFQ